MGNMSRPSTDDGLGVLTESNRILGVAL
jgi:hypothetical protein